MGKPAMITPRLEDIWAEIKPTRKFKVDTGGKE